MVERTVDEIIATVNTVYSRVRRSVEREPFTNATIATIFSEIDRVFYNNTFVQFIEDCNPAQPALHYKEKPGACPGIDALLEAIQYDADDEEFATHAMGFVTALPCLNSLGPDTIYYSGGYKTKNKLKCIILMLLHESIHILEYNDTILTASEKDHNLFFYYMAYKYFKIISRLSEYFTEAAPIQIEYSTAERERLLNDLKVSVESGVTTDLGEDGIEMFNDHSHTIDHVALGYLTYARFRASYMGGFRRTKRKYRKRNQKARYSRRN
jgi:hypothetical protein